MKKKLDIKKIQKMRKEGKTLQEIGKEFNRTGETIRMILKKQHLYSYCKKHSRLFIDECRYCVVENEYNLKIKKLNKTNLLEEIKKLSNPNREDYLIIQRAIIIKKLYDEYKLTFQQIGKLMCRHHSSIINLYYKKIK